MTTAESLVDRVSRVWTSKAARAERQRSRMLFKDFQRMIEMMGMAFWV